MAAAAVSPIAATSGARYAETSRMWKMTSRKMPPIRQLLIRKARSAGATDMQAIINLDALCGSRNGGSMLAHVVTPLQILSA